MNAEVAEIERLKGRVQELQQRQREMEERHNIRLEEIEVAFSA
jgi:hypothetical protein